ncbi:MAG: PTS sugar transporter subunit IIA [Enterococcus casseliflavus]
MKVIIASHGNFGIGLLQSYQMIAGENDQLIAIQLTDAGVEAFKKQFYQVMEQLKEEEVLILTDIKGGTPFNVSYNYLLEQKKPIKLVAGMNLPMLLEVGLAVGSRSFDALFDLAIAAGKDGVTFIEDDNEFEDENIF